MISNEAYSFCVGDLLQSLIANTFFMSRYLPLSIVNAKNVKHGINHFYTFHLWRRTKIGKLSSTNKYACLFEI